MNLLISLRSEMLKTRRTASFYFTLVGAAVVPFIFLLNVCMDGLESTRKDPLNSIFKLTAEMNGLVIFPMFVILACTLLPQIEYRNNTWKQVLTSPQTKGNVFFAKFINVQLLMLLFLVATHAFTFLFIGIAHLIDPSLELFNHSLDTSVVWKRAIYTYVTILAVSSLQFWIGIRFRNFITPIAIGLALWLAGLMMALEFKPALLHLFPYSFTSFGLSPEYASKFNQVAWTSVGYMVLILLIAFFDFSKRRMTA